MEPRSKAKLSRTIDKTTVHLLVVVFVLFIVFPFFWLITASIKPEKYIVSLTPYFLPPEVTFQHYWNVFKFANLAKIFFNTCVVSVLTVVFSLGVVVPASYAITILRVRRGKLISRFILSLQMVPGILLVIPLYLVMKQLLLLDSYWALIVSYTTFTIPFCFLLVTSYYGTLPLELFESAAMDGAAPFYAMIRIAIPLTAPGLVTTASYSFLNSWNDFLFANTFTSSDKARTLTVEVIRLIGTWGNRWGDLAAGATVTIVPVILVFFLANRRIIEGLTAGAVKG
jgi:ABC-type glycerol-3-phosphate transport system permease component